MTSLVPLAFSASLGLLVAGLASLLLGRREEHSSPSRGTRARVRPGSGIEDLLARSGRSDELTARSVSLARILGATVLPLLSLPVAGLLPGRAGLLLVAGMATSGFLAPNFILERAARRRLAKVVSSMPDALDLLSVQLASGRSIGAAMEDLARSGKGPLAIEMGIAADEMARGVSQATALRGLRRRTGGREIATFCSSVDRSRRLGSPLAVELRRQASAARIDQSRAVVERAARAAPKIQLVIALVLVPAVMLLVVAALVANSDRLIGFAFG